MSTAKVNKNSNKTKNLYLKINYHKLQQSYKNRISIEALTNKTAIVRQGSSKE